MESFWGEILRGKNCWKNLTRNFVRKKFGGIFGKFSAEIFEKNLGEFSDGIFGSRNFWVENF